MDLKKIGALARKGRKAQNLTQAEAAQRAGCHRNHASAIEKGIFKGRVHYLHNYLLVCGYDLAAVPHRPPAFEELQDYFREDDD